MCKSQTTREQAIEVGLSIREAEQRLDPELFLNKYPRWEIEAPHQCIILHEMFLHATQQGRRRQRGSSHEAAGKAYQGLDPEADLPAIKLVGYWTSKKEIRDLYHSVYLLRRSPGPLPCGPQQGNEAIWDILSSLRNCLHRWVYPATSEEDAEGATPESQSRSRRREDLHFPHVRIKHK